MEKIDVAGLSPEIIEYIQGLENKVKKQQLRIDNLMETLAKAQKAMFGQSSEKSRYVLGDNEEQLSQLLRRDVSNLFRFLWPLKLWPLAHPAVCSRG